MKFGPYTTKGKRGPAVRYVNKDTLREMKSFARWKEEAGRLNGYGDVVEKHCGTNIAEAITDTMKSLGKDTISSVCITSQEGAVHIPPKISYLIKLAIETSDNEEKLIDKILTPGGSDLDIRIILGMAIGDMSLGYARLFSVNATTVGDNYWKDQSGTGEPELYSVNMDNVDYTIACSKISGYILRRTGERLIIGKDTPGNDLSSMFAKALDGIMITKQNASRAEKWKAMNLNAFMRVMGFGRMNESDDGWIATLHENYVEKGIDSNEPELIIPLGARTHGSIMQVK
jgi:hypothetical protein